MTSKRHSERTRGIIGLRENAPSRLPDWSETAASQDVAVSFCGQLNCIKGVTHDHAATAKKTLAFRSDLSLWLSAPMAETAAVTTAIAPELAWRTIKEGLELAKGNDGFWPIAFGV